MFVDYSASTVYTLAFLACGHYSASILHSVPEANKIQQKLSRDFHVDLTPRDMAVKQTKSCETSSSSLIQANKYNMPINNWRSMKQISFLFSRVDGSLDLDAGQGIQCLGHLWLLGFLGGFIPSTSYDWYELFMFSPLVHWSPKMLRLWPHAMLLFFFCFLFFFGLMFFYFSWTWRYQWISVEAQVEIRTSLMAASQTCVSTI